MLFGIMQSECLYAHGKVMIIVSLIALDAGNTLGRRFNYGSCWD
jgi:hypothetical protein